MLVSRKISRETEGVNLDRGKKRNKKQKRQRNPKGACVCCLAPTPAFHWAQKVKFTLPHQPQSIKFHFLRQKSQVISLPTPWIILNPDLLNAGPYSSKIYSQVLNVTHQNNLFIMDVSKYEILTILYVTLVEFQHEFGRGSQG